MTNIDDDQDKYEDSYEDEDWWDGERSVDGFMDWPEVTDELVHEDWLDLGGGGLRLYRVGRSLIVLDLPSLKATQRRALHRAGFRRTRGAIHQLWCWTFPMPVLPTDLRERFRVAFQDASDARLALAQQATRVAQDVLGVELTRVSITLATEWFREQERRSWG